MAEAPAGGGGAKQDPQALIAKHAAVTQAGAAGDAAIVARVENSIKNSPMGWLQGMLGEVGSRAASEQGEVKGKLAEHEQLVSTNQKDAPKDAGPPPPPGPAAHPAVPQPQAAAAKGGPVAQQSAAAGPAEAHAPIPAHPVAKSGPAQGPAAAPAPTIASAIAGAGNDAQLDGILNAYTPKSPQTTQTLGRIKQMGDIANGFNGQLDVYVSQGGAVDSTIAASANFLGVGKDANAIWRNNPYRKVHGILGGIMTGMSAVKSVCSIVGSICGKLGMVLTVIGLLGMIFPPIGAAVSGIARILSVVGMICDAISFVLSGILTGLNGVVLAQQIAAGASAEEKAATADMMMSEANEAASGFINMAMIFGPKFMKGLMGSSKGIVSSLMKQAKATIGRISLKVSANVSHFANKIVRKLGFGGSSFTRVEGAWKDTGFFANMKAKAGNTAIGRAFNGAPAHLESIQEKLMAKYGNTTWAKNMDRVGAWGGSVAHRFDIEDKVGKLGEKSGKWVGGLGADTKLGKSMAAAAERSELQTRELAMKMQVRDASHLEDSRWKNELDRRQAANPDHIRNPEAEAKFRANERQKVADKAKTDFETSERQREGKEKLEQLRSDRFDRRNDEFYENKTNGFTGEKARDSMMDSVHNSRAKRYQLEDQFRTQETERKELLGKATRTTEEQTRLTALNGELRSLDEARRMNKMYEKDLSGLAAGTERVRAPEYNNWKDVASNAWESTAPMLEMMHLKDQDSAWELAEKANLKKQVKYNKGTSSGNSAGRGGQGTFEEIAADARHQQMDELTAFVRAQPQSATVSGNVRSMLSSVTARPQAAPQVHAPAQAPQVQQPPAQQTPTPAPQAQPGGVSVTNTPPAGDHAPGAAVQEGVVATAQVHEPATTGAVPHEQPKEGEPADDGAGEALPYWPSLLPEFDQATKDFGWMRKVAVEFKKAQIDGKQKAVDTLAVYGRYKEYAQLRAAAAKKNAAGAQATQGQTQQNVAHAQGTEGQAAQGEAKQGEAKGAANNKAATDLPEPESRGFWGRILGAVKRWAKNKAAQVFGWIQEKIASVVLKGLCGVSMGDMREYAGALRRQQQAAHGVAGDAAKTSGQADQTSIKLGADATKEAQAAADSIGECDKNITDADQFMADIGSFEQQLAEEKAHAQQFIAQVQQAAHAEQAKRQAEAAARAAEEAKERERAAALGQQQGPAAAAQPATTPTPAPAPTAEPAHEQAPEDPNLASDTTAIHSAADYVASQSEILTSRLDARADDYTNQLAMALTNRTGKGQDGVDLKGPAKKESKHIVEEFKKDAGHTKADMEAFHSIAIEPSHARQIAEQIINSAQHLEQSYSTSENALDELFARTYNGIKDGRRTLKSQWLDGNNTLGNLNEQGNQLDNHVIDTALPQMNTAWNQVSAPIQVQTAAPAPKAAAPQTTAPTMIARKEVDATPVSNAAIVTAAVGSAVASGPTVLVEDSSPQVTQGQLRKRDFLAKLEPSLKSAASQELGMLWSVAACPYIQHYLNVYGAKPAAEVEKFIRRYTGSKATDPDQLMADLVAKVRVGVREWKQTGKLPADVAAADPNAAAAAGTPNKPGEGPAAIQKKSATGDSVATEPATEVSKPEQVLNALGEGAPLDSATATRMGAAFNTSFSDVRVHADGQGNALAKEHNAHAFAVGTHVAFAPGKYEPGTVEGDALLAHELTHVMQQRGAAGPSGTDVSTPGDAHERDADVGAQNAVSRLHGGPGATNANDRAEAQTSSGLQLSRCEGTAEAPTIHRGFHEAVYTFDGDPFALSVDWNYFAQDKSAPTQIVMKVKYAGKDDPDNMDTEILLDMPKLGKQLAPKVTPDKPNGWSTLSVDPFGDGSFIGTFTHSTTMMPGWNPQSRFHLFGGKSQFGKAGEQSISVKSKNALPGTQENSGTTVVGQDTRPLRADVAALSTKTWLDEMLADPTFNLDRNVAPWSLLVQKVDQGAKQHTSATEQGAGDDAMRLTRVGEVLTHCRPMLKALGAASKKEAYLPDIADRAITMVDEVRGQFAAAVASSWDGPPPGLATAEQNFNGLWYRLSALYLEKGAGADKMLGDAWLLASNANDLRQGKLPYYQVLVQKLGGNGAPRQQFSDRQQSKRSLDQVREDFKFGKAGSAQEVTKIVEDTQLYTGLAGILYTSASFYEAKKALEGIVGGALDTFGRDIKGVCQGYIDQLEGLASGVEKSAEATGDLHAAGGAAVTKFQQLINTQKFKDDLKAIESRKETVEAIKMFGKVLAIVGVAALTGGVAGAAFAGALEGAGASAAVVATGEFAAEVVTFTAVNRLGNEYVLGQKPQVGWAEDLATNAVMMGFMKGASALYGKAFSKVIGDPKLYKGLYAAGGAVTGMVSLQVFAEAHYAMKNGKMMDMDERVKGVASNAVMMTALALGGYLAKPLNTRIKSEMVELTAKYLPGRLEALEAQIQAFKPQVDALKGPGRNADQAADLLKKIEKVWNDEVSVLNEVVKKEQQSGDAARRQKAQDSFKETVNGFVHEIGKLDLELANMGIESNLGANKAGNFFRPMSPNFVAFRAEGKEILESFYKENGGKLEDVPGKPGMLKGTAAGETRFYVPEGSGAESFFDKPTTKAPSEAEAKANHERARKEAELAEQRGRETKALIEASLQDGHYTKKLARVICGTGPAAAMDANTLPGGAKGAKQGKVTQVPDVIGVGTGKNTFEKLGDTPIGQNAPELSGPGYAEGSQPTDFSADHGGYASSSAIADAVASTQYRSGVPIVDCQIVEVSITKDGTWKVTDANVRIKVMFGSKEVFLYADATDLATGLGPPRELADGQISGDPSKAKDYRAALEKDKRLVNGDIVGEQRGGKVLVSGGSATGAWNAKVAAQLGAHVDWIAYDPASKPGAKTRPPRMEAASAEYKDIQQKLDANPAMPAAEKDALLRRQQELRAFDSAMLPRNTESATDAFNDVNIHRQVAEIESLTPSEEIPGAPAGKVKVTFKGGRSEFYDQVVTSHGTNVASEGAPGVDGVKDAAPKGALALATMELTVVEMNGQVVALESVNPKGAVRIIGAAMWSPLWVDGGAPGGARITDPVAVARFNKAMTEQALGAPRDSPANPLLHNVGKQVPAANEALPKPEAMAKPVGTRTTGPSGGRWGMQDSTEELLSDPHPSPEAKAIQDEAKAQYPNDQEKQLDYIWKNQQRLRQGTLSRGATSVPVVAAKLRAFGIEKATEPAVRKVFKYIFDSQGIAFDYVNYAAWERLATGSGTISDARFIVHELSEIGDMESRGVDVNGPERFKGEADAKAWRDNFDKEYMTSHAKALYTENVFLTNQLESITTVKLTPEEFAAIDPTSQESVNYMALPDGTLLKDNPNLATWRAKGAATVRIDATAAQRLGLTKTEVTYTDLVRAVKSAKLAP
ncbi:MAG: DUF4157 domain-containing protein [Kofleriaceae bacterium]